MDYGPWPLRGQELQQCDGQPVRPENPVGVTLSSRDGASVAPDLGKVCQTASGLIAQSLP